MHLVAEGAEGTVERRRVALAELETDRREDVARVVDALADRRLLTISDGVIELAHEALIREWPRHAGWIEEDRESFRLQHGLTAAAKEWERRGRDESDLYRGTRLTAVNEWRSSTDVALTRLERDFLDASNARRSAERTAPPAPRELRLAGLIGALTTISVVAIVALHQAHRGQA